MNFKRVKVITTVPHEDADKIRQALAKPGLAILVITAIAVFQ